ncbi:MAG: hypothetical protein ABJ246_10745 [Paracoccaceae bacterium]
MIELFGLLAVCAMVACYALEYRGPSFTLAFSGSCAVAALYAFLIGSYPFMLAEGVWAIVALRKWWARHTKTTLTPRKKRPFSIDC